MVLVVGRLRGRHSGIRPILHRCYLAFVQVNALQPYDLGILSAHPRTCDLYLRLLRSHWLNCVMNHRRTNTSVSDVENPSRQSTEANDDATSNATPTPTPTQRRLRLPHRSPHRSPCESPKMMPLASEENIDFQVLAIPDQPDPPTSMTSIGLNLSQRKTSDADKPDPPPLPNPRSSTSVDNPYFVHPTKFQPKFSDLKEEHGVFGACLSIAKRFLRHNYGILLFLAVLAICLALLGIFAFDENLSWEVWLSFTILCITLALLISNAVATPVAMLLGVTAMLLLKIVDPAKAIEGFSNEGVIAVAILFIVAEGIQRTSVLVFIFRRVLGKPSFIWTAQLRVMLPVAIVSAFLNNTPVVAMLIPVIQSWSRRANFPTSKLLMPLNNAAILGGTLTLLGTSTNLLVDGYVRDSQQIQALFQNPTQSGSTSLRVGLPIFGVTPVGAILLAVGIIYMLLASRFLLRDRGQTGVGAIIRNPREYTVALLVQDRSPIVGETVQEAGLRQLQGLYLVEVTRANGSLIPAVDPDTIIEAGDTLLFAGVVETVTELYHIPGLVPATGQSQKMKIERHHRRLVELVISSSSMLVGKTAKESKFRSRFSAAIIAVHRQGEHVKERIADIKLRAGDTLLVETGSEFALRFGKDSNFALVSEVSGSQPPREDRLHMVIAAAIATAMVALATAKVLPLMTAAAAASFLMIATGCLTLTNAAQAVNLQVVITIAASFGLSNGMEGSGAAEQLAKFIVNVFEPLGFVGLLFGIYVGTALLSSVITNNAAVALMFPVIVNILKARELLQPDSNGANMTKVLRALYALMIGASSSFSTPIGYQTNLMVHGPGGYTFLDWVIFGVPLQILLGVAGIISINNLSFSL